VRSTCPSVERLFWPLLPRWCRKARLPTFFGVVRSRKPLGDVCARRRNVQGRDRVNDLSPLGAGICQLGDTLRGRVCERNSKPEGPHLLRAFVMLQPGRVVEIGREFAI